MPRAGCAERQIAYKPVTQRRRLWVERASSRHRRSPPEADARAIGRDHIFEALAPIRGTRHQHVIGTGIESYPPLAHVFATAVVSVVPEFAYNQSCAGSGSKQSLGNLPSQSSGRAASTDISKHGHDPEDGHEARSLLQRTGESMHFRRMPGGSPGVITCAVAG
jgi:hypothetical protein